MAINKPSKKKRPFAVRKKFLEYLDGYERLFELPTQYADLERFNNSIPLLNSQGEDTLWETVFYGESDKEELQRTLIKLYAMLKADGDDEIQSHLSVDRIDFCTFGNTKPFRVRIINRLNDNYDHFYIKRTDASRLYGLELENLLSPNSMRFLMNEHTTVEEHVAGIPGDDFIKTNLKDSAFNQIRIAKEFVKFNERCFVRLLGDMRAYNYVVDITPDIEGSQFRIRAIDFDQQSYEGWKSFYLPQYFKENNPIIFLGIEHMSAQTVRQYQLEERSLIGNRIKSNRKRVRELLEIMVRDTISSAEKIEQLKQELAYHHKNDAFLKCRTMGEIVLTNIELLLDNTFIQSIDVR